MEDPKLVAGLVGIVAALVASTGAFFVQKWKLNKDFELDRERVRTEFMAEQVARSMLASATHRRRSFDALKKRLGGFDDNELRQILVRAGAIRFIGGTSKKEFWGLLDRNKDALMTPAEKNLQQQEMDETE